MRLEDLDSTFSNLIISSATLFMPYKMRHLTNNCITKIIKTITIICRDSLAKKAVYFPLINIRILKSNNTSEKKSGGIYEEQVVGLYNSISYFSVIGKHAIRSRRHSQTGILQILWHEPGTVRAQQDAYYV
jgi:hypothetical protein